ncbi:MAG: hypothetical protein JOZ37_20275 [Actinobacteria bacterium]|nr:hypothetical protein [Actinomycetota bacterium]MBV9933270.1 hypothetical protein [Actinomycetota bacterium]
MTGSRRAAVVGMVAALLLTVGAGAAFAVTDGNYQSSKQHCEGNADNSDAPKRVDPGCKSLIISLADGNQHDFTWFGLQQTADGESPDPMSLRDFKITNPRDIGSGLRLYFGADDNLDTGEHDSSDQVNQGPSDGGAIQFNVLPGSVVPWLNALAAGDASYLLTHPVPLVDFGTGACADGICANVQTQQRVAWQGDGKGSRNIANYEGKQWDPESCAGPDDKPKDCAGQPLRSWYAKDGTTYVEPGATIFEDPDPQGSPIGPYPLPAAYVGTCGVILGGGSAPAAPDSPMTNKAGQFVVETGC